MSGYAANRLCRIFALWGIPLSSGAALLARGSAVSAIRLGLLLARVKFDGNNDACGSKVSWIGGEFCSAFGNSLLKGSSFDRLFGILPPCFRPFRWLQIAQSSFMDPDFAMLIEKVVAWCCMFNTWTILNHVHAVCREVDWSVEWLQLGRPEIFRWEEGKSCHTVQVLKKLSSGRSSKRPGT
jgi:hypothetical protein